MSQSAMPALIRRAEATTGEGADVADRGDLLSFLLAVTDPRKRRGVRHALASLPTVAAAAVLAGARSFTAIGEWAADASSQVLAALGVRRNARTGRYLPPDEATVRRALQKVDPDEVDQVFAAFLAARGRRVSPARPTGTDLVHAVSVDGKTVRGARDHANAEDRAPHLVAAVTHAEGIVLAQRQVDDKSNEITAVRPLLKDLNLAAVVVTADSLCRDRHKLSYVDLLVMPTSAGFA